MKKELLLPLNLQFFGEEGESVTESEVAEPAEDATEASEEESSTEESTEVEESNVQSAEENAKYAAARRRAEAEFSQRQQAMDAEFARRFEGYENPITHQPIRNQRDYFEALDAQEKLKRDAELSERGIDPQMFEDMVSRQVNNNPIVQQAQMVMQAAQESQVQNKLAEDMKVISKLNPNLKTAEDVMNLPDAQDLISLVKNNGLSLADAYKLRHMDEILAGKSASAKQAALNTMNGTSHLNQTDSLANSEDGMVEIPQSELEQWKRAFPHASASELKQKYNRAINN
jgi:hypothetical protein